MERHNLCGFGNFCEIFRIYKRIFVADVFGTSALGDAFIVSLSIPDILVSGFTTAIATLYIPTYYKSIKEKHKNPKYQ